VDVGELLFWFLVVPAIGYGLAAIWMRWTMRRIAEREVGFLRMPGITSRFLVFLTYPSTPILFGIVVYVQLLGAPADAATDSAVRWLGLAFAVSAILTTLSQAWIVVRRRAVAYRGEQFTRTLVLTVIPETAVLFVLIVAIQVSGFLVRGPTEPPVSAAEASGLVGACQWALLGSVGAPLAAFLANRVPTLEGKSFSKAVIMTVGGEVPMLIGLVMAMMTFATL